VEYPDYASLSGQQSSSTAVYRIIHSGGHAHPEDLADLAHRLHARAVVPIHTEAALQFAALISNVRVVNDREPVEIASLIADYDIRTGLLAE